MSKHDPVPVILHHGDLPREVLPAASGKFRVALDTEAMGLVHARDRLCLVQVRFEQGPCHLVQIRVGHTAAQSPNLVNLLRNPDALKLFHFARFDMGILRHTLGVMPRPVYCTKVASRFARTWTDRHGLKDVCRDLLGVDLSKEEQSSDWGAENLTEAQKRYAAQDVLHLHALHDALQPLLERESRQGLVQGCLDFLPVRVEMDLLGMERMEPLNYRMSSE